MRSSKITKFSAFSCCCFSIKSVIFATSELFFRVVVVLATRVNGFSAFPRNSSVAWSYSLHALMADESGTRRLRRKKIFSKNLNKVQNQPPVRWCGPAALSFSMCIYVRPDLKGVYWDHKSVFLHCITYEAFSAASRQKHPSITLNRKGCWGFQTALLRIHFLSSCPDLQKIHKNARRYTIGIALCHQFYQLSRAYFRIFETNHNCETSDQSRY